MEISEFCYICKKFNKCEKTHDMQDMKPNCLNIKHCGNCEDAERIEGRNEMVGCKKQNVLRSAESECNYNEY